MNKPVVVVDLFCGMGGFSQGAIDAGAEVILSVDSWDQACDVHHVNHPNVRVSCEELGNPLWYKWLLKFLEPYRANHHIHLHGSPPCQALSNASRTNPEEGMPLVIWYLNLVKSVQPDSWSMENVVPVRKRLPEGTPNVILNSADFGVPQTRRRCYAGSGWVAEPTHSKDEWVSVIQALPNLLELVPVPSMVKQYAGASKDKPYPTVTSQSPKQLRLMLNTGGYGSSISRPSIERDSDVQGPTRTVCNNAPSLRTVKLEALGSNSKRHQDRPIDEPSKTICGSGNQVGPRIFDHSKVTHNVGGATESIGEAAENRDRVITEPSKVIRAHHTTLRDRTDWDKPRKIRSLTMPETLVLQGFSPDYDLSVAKTQKARWTMVGNAVPPGVAEAVIRGIIQ